MPRRFFPITRQIIVSILVVGFFASTICFRHHFFRFGVEQWLNIKYRVEGGWKFNYGKISFDRDRMVFSDISLQSNSSLIDLKLERLDFVCKHVQRISFDVALICQSPEIKIVHQKEGSGLTVDDIIRSSLFQVRLDVEKAVIELCEEDVSTKVYLSLSGDETKRSLGTFYLSDKPMKEEVLRALLLEMKTKNQKIEGNLDGLKESSLD